MNALPSEAVLRREFGLPPNRAIAPEPCLRRNRKDLSHQAMGDPEDACVALGLDGIQRLSLVDDLVVHGDFAPAYDLASYLAASPSPLPAAPRRAGKAFEMGAVTVLRLTAALAAIQGGLYHRAFMSLIKIRQLLKHLPSAEPTQLLKANHDILMGRLAQVQGLPQVATQALKDAEERFKALGKVPPGLAVLQARSRLETNPGEALRDMEKLEGSDGHVTDDHVLGIFAEHYYYYLRGRLHLQLEHWAEAQSDFNTAQGCLDCCRHDGQVDRLREAFVLLGQARVKIGLGRLRSERKGELEGLKELRDAIARFRQRGFVPGEYFATRYWLELSAPQSQSPEDLLRARKGLHELARRTGVTRLQLEAAVPYGKDLFDHGRPIKARSILRPILETELGAFIKELKDDPIWKHAQTLSSATESAAVNGILPDAQWGLSAYAEKEVEFVIRCRDEQSNALVSTSGDDGSGRRILLERIAKARGIGGIVSVGPARRPAREIETDLERLCATASGVVLHNLDLWDRQSQRVIEQMLDKRPEREQRRRFFATLTDRLEEVQRGNQLSPLLAEILHRRYTWSIEPLAGRTQDTLLLARGFLVRLLIARGEYTSVEEGKDLIFTSDAARYIRQSYTNIRDLYRAMEYVAAGLRVKDDLFDGSDRFSTLTKLPLEAILRLVPPATPGDPRPGVPSRPPARPPITDADADMVRALAEESGGRLNRVAEEAGVPRSTLIRAWTRSGMLKVWRESGGRKLDES